MLWLPVAFNYLVMPLADFLFGEDRSNPPESAVAALEEDRYYRYITYAVVPVLWITYIFAAWFVSRHTLPWYGELAVILTHRQRRAAFASTLATSWDTSKPRWSAGWRKSFSRPRATVTSPSSTIADTISMSPRRAILLRPAWAKASGASPCAKCPERSRAPGVSKESGLARFHQPVWSLHNEILQPLLLTLVFYAVMVAWLGIRVLPFLVLSALWANFQLTCANYVEHYGLLRRKLSRRQLRALPALSLLEQQPHVLQLGAVPFAAPLRPPHLSRTPLPVAAPLRQLPTLPNGYFGMFTLAYFPPLWYRVMDPRLLRAVQRDPSRINFAPAKRERLIAKYGL